MVFFGTTSDIIFGILIGLWFKTHKLQSKTHEQKFKTHLVLKHTTREKTIFGAKKCLKHTGFF